MIICITGTPGTGKTYLATRIAEATKYSLKLFDLNEHIKDKKLYASYDKEAETHDVDVDILKKKVASSLRKYHSKSRFMDKLVGKNLKLEEFIDIISKAKSLKGIIVDSHLSHYLDNDYCIVVKSDIKDIYKRLKSRDYSQKKIDENIQSEIFEICLDEARSAKDNIIIVNN